MGRTSKLSRKFDMVLFVIFAMGIFVIILSVGAEYSWDWWITVISYVVLLSIVVCIMGTGYYYNKTIEYQKEDGQLQKRKIKNGYSSFCNSECTVTITKFENQQMDEIRQKFFEIQNLVFDMQIKANNKFSQSCRNQLWSIRQSASEILKRILEIQVLDRKQKFGEKIKNVQSCVLELQEYINSEYAKVQNTPASDVKQELLTKINKLINKIQSVLNDVLK